MKLKKNNIYPVNFILLLTILLPVFNARASSRSTSVALPMQGSLKNAEALPSKGAGYKIIKTTRERRTRFGTNELVMMIKTAAFRVSRTHPHSLLMVADLSRYPGGLAQYHASHQNGRDVDFLFYATDMRGRAVQLEEFIPFDLNGYSTDPPMKYKFCDQRNWAIVEELLTSPHAQVQFIFVADHLKQRLLTYAAQNNAPKNIINRASQVMRQPQNNAHLDHFHIRIYCSQEDKPHCQDQGPTWPWINN